MKHRSLMGAMVVAVAMAAGLHVGAQVSAPAAPSVAPPAPAAPPAAPAAPVEQDLDVKPAMAAAEEWLAAVDAGRFGESWERGSAAFRQAVTRADWEKALVSARGALGSLIGRKLVAANYSRQLPNAPAGEYVVIQYQARYENRPLAVETVTSMREADGRWKVAGYYIR